MCFLPPARRVTFTCLGLLAAVASGCFSSTPSKPASPDKPELHEIVLDNAPPEERGAEVLSAAHHTHRDLLDELDLVVKEPMIKGVFLRLSGLGGAWARASELQAGLARVRAEKKPVHCHFDMLDNSGYAVLASSCDRISMGPTGLLSLTGVQAESIYAKDLLDMVGLEAELLQVGRFKGAADALTRNSMPPEVHEVLDQLVGDLQGAIDGAITTGRQLDANALHAAIDSGPHAPDSALQHKLIDAVAFDDEARSKAKEAASADRVVRVLRDDDSEKLELNDLFKSLFSGKAEKPKGERIGLAYLAGTITDDSRERGGGSASGPFVTAMRRFADDSDVRALVLRIDSPGGSALASDKMWHAVRRVAKRKPVIISVGDMAASGGYYVACAGTEIFAQPESVLGSIGVVGGKIVGQGLASRIGIRPTALSRGKNAGWMSPFHPFSPSERVAVQRAMQQTYDTFIARVQEGRKLELDRIAKVAEGRIMTGKRAQSGGLVDTLGGLHDAIAQARTKGGVAADAKIEVWPKERSMLERASQLFGAEAQAMPLEQVWSALPELAQSPVVSEWLRGELSPLAALPYALRLR
ncbi:MAG: signal peptide peptidase SppA [Polyangiales bacterium]